MFVPGEGLYHVLNRFLQFGKLLLDRRLFLFLLLDYLAGILLKGGSQCVGVLLLKKTRYRGGLEELSFSEQINPYFRADTLKGLDIAVCDFDVADTGTLPGPRCFTLCFPL